jgi:bacterioferritin-associated ferredoxin
MAKCVNCLEQLGRSTGESQLYGSRGVGSLCEECWLAEDSLVEEEGTNAPEFSEAIARRLEHYRANRVHGDRS